MLISLDKLLTYKENKYVLTKALMNAIDKIAFIKDYPEENINWKVVPNILKLYMNGKLQFKQNEINADSIESEDTETTEDK